MSWRVARSLDVLLGEIDAAAPRRNKAADGSIGDAAHATRTSDHNPWVIKAGQGIVRARDFTHDPAAGLDCNQLANRLAGLIALGGHPACRTGAYVIWRGRIFSFDRRGEGWRPYPGSNPHDHHCHLSVTTDPAGFDTTRPWFVMAEEDDMADPKIKAQLDRMEGLMEETLTQARRAREGSFKRDKELREGLDRLAADVSDDATKTQVNQLIKLLDTE